jgi:recombination protein RecT
MTATTVSQAVSVRDKSDQLVNWIRSQQDDIAMAAATHVKPSAIIRVTQGALRRNPKLLAAAIANPQSLLYCLLDCARLGHEPDTDDYYLVPFGSEVTGIEGYKGIIERMYRAGAVSSVVAEVVYQQDVYRRTGATTPPVHEFDEFADPASRGPLRGAYAYAVMLDGRFSKVIPMGRAEIMKHKAKSRGSDKADSPWKQWEESMWKKCPLRGLEPYVPTSAEYRIAAAAHPAASAPLVLPGRAERVPEPEVYDAEIIDDSPGPAPAPGQPAGHEPAAGPGPTPADGADGAASTGAPAAGPGAPAAGSPPGGDGARPARPTGAQAAQLGRSLTRILGPDPDDLSEFMSWRLARPVTGLDGLTRDETASVRQYLDAALKDAQGSTQDAASAIWQEYRAAHPQPEAGEQDG